jgi:hypothetical protein
LAIAGALLACIPLEGARAQPFGGRVILVDHDRGGGHREERREEHGGRGGEGDRGERGGGYRGQPYAPAPRGYAYPAPAYPYRQSPPPQAYAPPQHYAPPQAYAPPPAYASPPRSYSYAPAPNSLGSGWRPQQPEARRQGNVPLGQVMANINSRTPGRMLDAGVEPGPDGRPAYRVRWAARGGHRIDFIVDAATGAIIGQSGY